MSAAGPPARWCAPLQPASWPHRLSSLLSKLFPFIRAAAVGRSRPAESSTSLFDRLGVMSTTGTSQVSSAQRIPRRAAALLEKIAAFAAAFVIGPLFSPSTAAPSIHRLALTLWHQGRTGAARRRRMATRRLVGGDARQVLVEALDARPLAVTSTRSGAAARWTLMESVSWSA